MGKLNGHRMQVRVKAEEMQPILVQLSFMEGVSLGCALHEGALCFVH